MINFSCLSCGGECEKADESAGWEYYVMCPKCGFKLAFQFLPWPNVKSYYLHRYQDGLVEWQCIPEGCLLVFDLKEGEWNEEAHRRIHGS